MGKLAKVMGGLEQLAETRKQTLRAKPTEDMGTLDRRRVEAAKAPYEMAGTSPLKQIEMVSNPRRTVRSTVSSGHALDLNALGDWDLAHFEPLERKRPTTVSKRVEQAYTPENVRDFERYVRKGATEGGLEWYDMSPLSRVALQEMSPEDFKVLMAMNAATSARSSVDDQIKRASLAWYYRKQGIPWPMTNPELADVADPGYGHLAHDIHSKHLGPLVAGEQPNFSSIDQPKYASYYGNFTGNMAPLTADTHYQALHGFPMKETYNKFSNKWIEAPDFSKDVDYPFAEAFSGDRARRMGIPLPLYQASAWVGGKEATGVRDARPFAAVYDDLIGRTAQQMEITPLEALKKHLRGELPLMPIEKADGGRVLYHATTRAVKNLRPGKGKWVGAEDLGVHLGSSESANARLADALKEGRRGAPNIMPIANEFTNPLRMNDVGNWKSPFRVKDEITRLFPDRAARLEDEFKRYSSTDNEEGAMDILRQHLRELGHDSIVYKNAYENGGDSYIALDPSRLRSIFSGAGEPIGSRTAVEPKPEGYAGGGRVGGTDALMQYIRYRLPNKYATAPIEHMPHYGGSSREVFSLGDDKLVKMAKRPRGLHEQSLEGDPRVAKNLPELFWRSPDNELSVVQHMPHTPSRSEDFMQPLSVRWGQLQDQYGDKGWNTWHRSDPLLSGMMGSSGLGDFKQFDLHGPDFFLAPEDHWSVTHGRKPHPTLLDPGALDSRITNPQFERTHAGKFGDVVNNRLETMLPRGDRRSIDDIMHEISDPSYMGHRYDYMSDFGIGRGTEDFIGPGARWPAPITGAEPTDELTRKIKELMPNRSRQPNDQGTFGFASGGDVASRLSAIRQHLAGGGAPRNWLRGVKGSAIDEALLRFKSKHAGRISPTNVEAAKLILAGKANGTVEHAKEVLGTDARAQAMEKWIDTNLGNYIVKQHGTENDPLKTQNLLPHPSAVAKIEAAEVPERFKKIHEGQGWYGYSKEDREKHLSLPPWLNKLAEQDTPRYQSDREYKKALGSLEFNMAALKGNSKVLPEAEVEKERALEMQRDAREKYQRRMAPTIHLHDLDDHTWKNYYDAPMNDTLDYLSHRMTPRQENGREILDLKPEELHRMSVADAVRGSQEWHAAMAKKAEQAAALKMGDDSAAYKVYPDKWRWIEMGGNLENGEDMQLAQKIGKQLGHCYQDPETCESYLANSKLYSLIDPKGKAHATLEAQENAPGISGDQLKRQYGARGADIWGRWMRHYTGREPGNYQNLWDVAKEMHPDIHDALKAGATDITQIRGKQFPPYNNVVEPEAQPYVHDFLRTGKWGEINEAKNAGLMDLGTEGYEAVRPHLPHPRYVTQEELQAADRIGNPHMYSDEAKGFAKGGMVQAADFPTESSGDALYRAQLSLAILQEELEADPSNDAIKREIHRTEILIAKLSGAGIDSSVKDQSSLGAPSAAAPLEGDEQQGDPLDMLERLMTADDGDDMLSQLMAEDA